MDLLIAVAVVLGAATLALAVAAGVLWWSRRRARVDTAEAVQHADALERRTLSVLAAGRDGVVLHAPDGRVIELNEAAARVFDRPRTDLIGMLVTDIPVTWISEDNLAVSPASVFAGRGGGLPGDPATFTVGAVPASGASVRWVQTSTRVVPSAGGGHELLTTLADVTGPREIRAALARSETQFRLAMENAPIGMVLTDRQWRLVEVNAAFAQLLGVTPDSLLGRDLSTLSHPGDRAAERAHVQQVLAGVGSRFSLEKRYLRADGQTVWAVLDAVLVRSPSGEPDQFVAQVRDSTEARMQSEMLAHRAMHDPLTGLGNRAAMQEELTAALAEPDADGRVAVIVTDLDEFKEINDRYGHAAGDDVLVHVAGVLRASCGGRGTAFRLGGDEFVVVVRDPQAGPAAFEIATAVHRGLANPVRTQQRRFPVRASLGVAVVDDDLLPAGATGLLAAGDAALYRAKNAGRGRTEVYTSDMDVPEVSRHGLQHELSRALEEGQLVLHFQPVVDLATRQVVGHEALVRWQHPDRGLLLPGSFLEAASEGGLSVRLGLEVVRLAATHLVSTRSAGRWVSINVSAEQLGDGELVAAIRTAMSRAGLETGRMIVELTETSLDPSPGIRRDLVDLHAAGVPVLIDAFGTGVPPLPYLRDLPLAGIKLDMSFTAGIPEDPAAARVSVGLGAMTRAMGLMSVAEGVETSEQATFLRDSGWQLGQGWLFGPARTES
ncbi:EAL domain-containing protein [Actinotalea sp. M2MS4P-6]|uniref:putative bifunctional diguanylate cyclase/phosphodiesterase n=1 Tax=Actinotalea sp. M2MS4P-6 TaxID=2983762 RepID=UPI0021E47FFE|nr:EAL domain-containing protein [Actinotalea sp. M2MS4P-6]MCV2396142.1 EAL domain-containing protein [Actinotalea sp. M2MS4P-6]